ncbi:FGGY-family carbohydrate kinase [Pedococcus sp. 5OH_020]|uniref:FGGY-family carbohydrate kinase n=1 Tax=Pedococcus sp. 5OH_020 TaxID=2989814 RepID=UPI0022E9F29E|nr:FGGY family carbohydrate kinase [Pedococcus sp. 5OH_020]
MRASPRKPMPEQRAVTVGVDIGTYETKATAVDAIGAVVATAKCPHQLSLPAPGFAEHDAETVWWGGLVTAVRSLLDTPSMAATSVQALCCSGIGPAVVPTTAAGRALRPAILYGIDTRAGDQADQIEQRLGAATITARSGNQLSSQSAGPKIAWLAQHEPDVVAATAVIHTCQSFLVHRLTGQVVMDHATASYFHPLYSLREHRWDTEGCEWFVRPEQLPSLAWSDQVAGRLLPEPAAQIGLPVGTPVLVGSADAPCEALACDVEQPHSAMVMYGSSGFMIAPTADAMPGAGLYCAPGLTDGSWLVAAGTSTAGTATRWLTQLLRLGGEPGGSEFVELVALASLAPKGSLGLLVLPHFSGERTPFDDPAARGVIEGLSLAHGRAELARAVLEGIAHSMVLALASMLAHADTGGQHRRLSAIGGGTANLVWLQAVSDIAGLPQQVFKSPGASYGGALLAGRAIGLLERNVVPECRQPTLTIDPDEAAHAAYVHDHERFSQVYTALRQVRTA